MSDILKWLQDKANEEFEYEDGDYFLEAIKQFTYLRAELSAVTAERDRMREALKPFAKKSFDCGGRHILDREYVPISWLLDARAALEGVTEPPR